MPLESLTRTLVIDGRKLTLYPTGEFDRRGRPLFQALWSPSKPLHLDPEDQALIEAFRRRASHWALQAFGGPR